jgi:hypothetical protein
MLYREKSGNPEHHLNWPEVLVCCTEKNLATLSTTAGSALPEAISLLVRVLLWSVPNLSNQTMPNNRSAPRGFATVAKIRLGPINQNLLFPQSLFKATTLSADP